MSLNKMFYRGYAGRVCNRRHW